MQKTAALEAYVRFAKMAAEEKKRDPVGAARGFGYGALGGAVAPSLTGAAIGGIGAKALRAMSSGGKALSRSGGALKIPHPAIAALVGAGMLGVPSALMGGAAGAAMGAANG
jgi:hypothetical protein